jgi:hypothetical protein
MLPEWSWLGCCYLIYLVQVKWYILYLCSCWGGNISGNLLKPSWFCIWCFRYFPLCPLRETHHYLVNILMPYFLTIQQLYLWLCTSLGPRVSIIQLYEPILSGFLKGWYAVQFWITCSGVGGLCGCTKTYPFLAVGSIRYPQAYSHFHGYQLSPSSFIITYCIDSTGNPIVSSP